MNLKSVTALAFALALAVAPAMTPAMAQDRAELALQAVDAGFLPQIQTRIMDSLWPATEKLIHEKLPAADDARIAEFRQRAEGFARESAAYALVPMGVQLAKTFDEDELRQLIAFYSSPVGQKLNSVTGDITNVFVNDVTKRVNEQIPAFQVRIEEMIAAEAGN